MKRVLDIALSLLMLVALHPVILAISLAIRAEDGGPVLYRQDRWGKDGRRFRIYKFRTMIPESDRRYGILPAEEKDPRITTTGRILRATGLDELPQVLNILKGEMSFVGPRSLAVEEILRSKTGPTTYEEIPGFEERLRVLPGLTSPATIYLPKDACPRRKIQYDLFYVRENTFSMDLRLIALSIWISLRGKWESRGSKVS